MQLKPNEPTTYSDQEFKQLGVGRLSVSIMAYTSTSNSTDIRYEIKLSSIKAGSMAGWGKTIFSGTLEELIGIVSKEVNNA